MSQSTPLISVITVCFNSKEDLNLTIQSVLAQTYPNVEYIVIDGGSTDGTFDILYKYRNCFSYWVSESDNGIYDAMNKGISKASGEWIIFMNAGDFFASDSIIDKIFKEDCTNYDVIYGDTIHIFKDGYFLHKAESLCVLHSRMAFCHQSSFVRTSILKEYKFDCSFRIAADYNLFHKLYLSQVRFKQLNLVISVFDNIYGISSNNHDLFLKEYSQINESSVFLARVYYFFRSSLKLLIKRICGASYYNKILSQKNSKQFIRLSTHESTVLDSIRCRLK